MNLFGATAVSRTRIEHQVEIVQIRSTFGQVAADHSDAAKAYDAVVLAKTGGLDIAKRHRCRQVIEPHEPSSIAEGGAQRTATSETPRRPAALAGEREGANQGQALLSACTLRSKEKSS